MIKPTIGRIVWYWPHRHMSQPFAAQISFVHDDTCVNLGFLYEFGHHASATSITLWQGEGDKPAMPYCEWMPYQHLKQAESVTPT